MNGNKQNTPPPVPGDDQGETLALDPSEGAAQDTQRQVVVDTAGALAARTEIDMSISSGDGKPAEEHPQWSSRISISTLDHMVIGILTQPGGNGVRTLGEVYAGVATQFDTSKSTKLELLDLNKLVVQAWVKAAEADPKLPQPSMGMQWLAGHNSTSGGRMPQIVDAVHAYFFHKPEPGRAEGLRAAHVARDLAAQFDIDTHDRKQMNNFASSIIRAMAFLRLKGVQNIPEIGGK